MRDIDAGSADPVYVSSVFDTGNRAKRRSNGSKRIKSNKQVVLANEIDELKEGQKVVVRALNVLFHTLLSKGVISEDDLSKIDAELHGHHARSPEDE